MQRRSEAPCDWRKDTTHHLAGACSEAWLVDFQTEHTAVLGYVKAYQCLAYVQPSFTEHL